MSARRVSLPALAALLLVGSLASAAEPAARDVQALADKIDQIIAKRWTDSRAQPAPLADDAEFCRRVYLDLAGRIPSVEEARTFIEDKRADRRVRVVEHLLGG